MRQPVVRSPRALRLAVRTLHLGASLLTLSSCAASPAPVCHCAACPPCHAEACPPATTPVEPPPPLATPAPATPATAPDDTANSEQRLLTSYEGRPAKKVLQGKATYYSNSLAGRKTASGEVYDPKAFTAAHRTLPFGTVVRVIRTDTNRYVYVRITDRGPFGKRDRIIDVSYVAAERLGMLRAGVVPVRVEILD